METWCHKFFLPAVEVESTVAAILVERKVDKFKNLLHPLFSKVGNHCKFLIEVSRGKTWPQTQEYIVKLSDVQVRRHKIFSWYFRKWRKLKSNDWRDFSGIIRDEFKEKFAGKPVPRANTTLASNFSYILKKMAPYSGRTKDIFLFFYKSTTDGFQNPQHPEVLRPRRRRGKVRACPRKEIFGGPVFLRYNFKHEQSIRICPEKRINRDVLRWYQ